MAEHVQIEKRRMATILLIILGLGYLQPVIAQDNIPQQESPSLPISAPPPGSNPSAVPGNITVQLPLTVLEAKARVEELKSVMPDVQPRVLEETVLRLGQWLEDLAQEHNRLAGTFFKYEPTKIQSQVEKQTALQFQNLKNQVELIRVQLLINQNRYPEAIKPLVDIVVTEPRSLTGQEAFRYLKEIGFCEDKPLISKPDATKNSTLSK